MVVQQRDGPRRPREIDDDDDLVIPVIEQEQVNN